MILTLSVSMQLKVTYLYGVHTLKYILYSLVDSVQQKFLVVFNLVYGMNIKFVAIGYAFYHIH